MSVRASATLGASNKAIPAAIAMCFDRFMSEVLPTLIVNNVVASEISPDGYQWNVKVLTPRGPAMVSFPSELIHDIGAHALAMAPQPASPAEGLQRHAGFRFRDAAVSHSVDGGVTLRIGFHDQSNVHLRLTDEQARQIEAILAAQRGKSRV